MPEQVGTPGPDVIVGTDIGESETKRIAVDYSSIGPAAPQLQASLSPDGSKIVFVSNSSDLVPDDTNGTADIFVTDLATGVVTRVSTGASGEQAIGVSPDGDTHLGRPVFSPDGTKVAFQSLATNLVPGDTNGISDIFVKDLITGAIMRVSTDSAGNQVSLPPGSLFGSDVSGTPIFTPDGKSIFFQSYAPGLVAGDPPFPPGGGFLKNLETGETTAIRLSPRTQPQAGIESPVISPDGSKLLFASGQKILNFPANGISQLFIKDLRMGEVSLVSATPNGGPAHGFSFFGTFSPDGSKIYFYSVATNLTPQTFASGGLYVRDLATGTTTLALADANGLPIPIFGRSLEGTISSDGTQLLFVTGVKLSPDDADTLLDIYLKDFATGEIELISAEPIGTPAKHAYDPIFTPDGRIIFSTAGALTPDDDNGNFDLYIKAAQIGGADHIQGLAGDDIISGKSGGDALDGGDDDDQLNGGLGDDMLIGGAGTDVLNGDDGDDMMLGGTGRDILYGGLDDDEMFGGTGKDYLNGGLGNDRLSGEADDDYLGGGEGDDVIDGGTGNDRLRGGPGDDVLTGGTGRDIFIISDAFGIDRITDFEGGPRTGDRIDLRAVDQIGDFATLRAMMVDVDGNVEIDFSIMLNGPSILVIENVSSSQLAANDFLL